MACSSKGTVTHSIKTSYKEFKIIKCAIYHTK